MNRFELNDPLDLLVAPIEGTPGGVDEVLRRAYPGDAGFDLFCQHDAVIPAGQRLDIHLGVRVELPAGWWGLLTGRSSTLRNRGLLVSQGVIDNGYRGPLYAYVANLGTTSVRVEKGERLAQLIPLPIFPAGARLVPFLSEHERGEQGFGSSGR